MKDAENKPPLALTAAIDRVLQSGLPAALATLIEAPRNVGAKMVVSKPGIREGSLGDLALDEMVFRRAEEFLGSKEEILACRVKEFAPHAGEWAEAQVLFERLQLEPKLIICGAGHVGAALAQMASLMGYRSTLIDDRAEFLSRERFPDEHIELVVAEQWFEAVAGAVGSGRGVFVSIVTRGHSEDEQCLRAVMASARPDYVGLIGSKRRTNIVLQRLRDSGADEERLKEVHAPIGLDIGAVTPEEVALAILAEIVAKRRGGKGESLSAWRRQDS